MKTILRLKLIACLQLFAVAAYAIGYWEFSIYPPAISWQNGTYTNNDEANGTDVDLPWKFDYTLEIWRGHSVSGPSTKLAEHNFSKSGTGSSSSSQAAYYHDFSFASSLNWPTPQNRLFAKYLNMVLYLDEVEVPFDPWTATHDVPGELQPPA